MHRWLAMLTSHDDGSGAATLLAQDKRVNASAHICKDYDSCDLC